MHFVCLLSLSTSSSCVLSLVRLALFSIWEYRRCQQRAHNLCNTCNVGRYSHNNKRREREKRKRGKPLCPLVGLTFSIKCSRLSTCDNWGGSPIVPFLPFASLTLCVCECVSFFFALTLMVTVIRTERPKDPWRYFCIYVWDCACVCVCVKRANSNVNGRQVAKMAKRERGFSLGRSFFVGFEWFWVVVGGCFVVLWSEEYVLLWDVSYISLAW